MIYLDSAALIKLVLAESETDSLISRLKEKPGENLTASELVRVEVPRALDRLGDDFAHDARLVLDALDMLALDTEVLRAAALLGTDSLSSLDAIHLASALSLDSSLSGFISYDSRLLDEARQAGLPVEAPGMRVQAAKRRIR